MDHRLESANDKELHHQVMGPGFPFTNVHRFQVTMPHIVGKPV